MGPGIEAAVRLALARVVSYQRSGRMVDRQVREDILREVRYASNRSDALHRRDDALRAAYAQLGQATPINLFALVLRRFVAEKWPLWSVAAEPPESARPLDQHLFAACQAADLIPRASGRMAMPDGRQLRRIVVT